jgi:hypothetical protein
MRVGISWRHHSLREIEPPQVFEVVTPRTNTAALSSAENLFASIALDEPCSFEIAADHAQRQFLIRASGAHMRQQLLSQTAAAYPQADLRALSADHDPARLRLGEQLLACTLQLRAPAYLPLRTFSDVDVDGERAAQADPLLGILSNLGDLPAGWRGLSQLVVQAAPDDWCRGYQRRAVQHPLEHERVQRPIAAGLPMLAFFALLLGLVAVGLQAYVWFRNEQWPPLVGLVTCTALALLVAVLGIHRLFQPAVYDMELVREKVTRVAYRAEVRLIVFAPAQASPLAIKAQLDRLATAYRRYNLAAANGLVPRPLNIAPDRPPVAAPVGSRKHLPILTTLELAGLWHLPHAAADVALLERTTARRWLPLPAVVAEGCRVGVSHHQGHAVPVSLPPDVLRRHMLLVAKTRRGKSTLMQRLALFAMQAEPRRAVLLVDPHRDLAEATVCQVPTERRADVVFLDVGDRARPFGLNLLDACLGWDRDRAVANALAVFQREWGDRYWGPRMEDAFRFALLSLFEANLSLCAADPTGGRAAQYTLLEVPTILSEPGFRRHVLSSVTDPSVRAWWSDYFEPLDRRFQLELINPVLTKIHRFDGNTASRHIVGQPASTIDPGAWLRDGSVVIVNTARGVVGDNAAALIGSTLLNLVTLGVAEQARLESAARRPITIFVDEFHTIPGADYEAILAELSKYGANLVLATQSLSRLLALGRDDGRGLRATVFANLDALVAFNCSAEDAEYLVPELGGALDAQDLVELGEHQCYVRLSSGGRRLPTFSVNLDPPQSGEPGLGERLKEASAQRFGRAAELVEADRRSAVARVLGARALKPAEPPKRNEHRPRKKRRTEAVASNA